MPADLARVLRVAVLVEKRGEYLEFRLRVPASAVQLAGPVKLAEGVSQKLAALIVRELGLPAVSGTEPRAAQVSGEHR